jgi:hypothetical protein
MHHHDVLFVVGKEVVLFDLTGNNGALFVRQVPARDLVSADLGDIIYCPAQRNSGLRSIAEQPRVEIPIQQVARMHRSQEDNGHVLARRLAHAFVLVHGDGQRVDAVQVVRQHNAQYSIRSRVRGWVLHI